MSAQPPPKGTPPALARVWNQLKCRFGDFTNYSEGFAGKPTSAQLSCHPKGRGYSIDLFKNKQLGRAWWQEYWLDCGSYFAVKGKIVVTAQDGPAGDSYNYEDTVYAAKKIGGRVLEGGEDCTDGD